MSRTKLAVMVVGANIDELLGALIASEGSVKGHLERFNVHNRLEFVIFPPIPGSSVKCVFPEHLLAAVHDAISKNVTVHGTLHFRAGRPFPDLVEVKGLEIHLPDEQLPTLADLRGSWKGCMGDLNSVDFLQAKRDE